MRFDASGWNCKVAKVLPKHKGRVELITSTCIGPLEEDVLGIDSENRPYESHKWLENDLYENENYCRNITVDELKKIRADAEEYCEGQICYYYYCELLATPLDDIANLKEVLIRNKVLGKDDNFELIKIDDPAADFEPISDEWRFSDEIKQRFLDVFKNADGYYKVYEDDWSICRIVQKGDEAVLLDFFICD